MIKLNFTMPPSVNNLFATVGKRRVVSKRYAEWRIAAGWEIQIQKPGRLGGKVRIDIKLEDKGNGDGDNYVKPLFDVLVKNGVIEGDSRKIIRDHRVRWDGTVSGAVVEIFPIPDRAVSLL